MTQRDRLFDAALFNVDKQEYDLAIVRNTHLKKNSLMIVSRLQLGACYFYFRAIQMHSKNALLIIKTKK